MFWALKSREKSRLLASEILNFGFPNGVLKEYTLLVEADVDFFVTCQREAAALLKTVKRMLYLGYVLLRYVLIYNLEVSFNFHLTFLQLNVIQMFPVQ